MERVKPTVSVYFPSGKLAWIGKLKKLAEEARPKRQLPNPQGH